VLLATAYAVVPAIAVEHPAALVTLLTAVLAVPPASQVRRGSSGRDLVPVLKATGLCLLAYGVVLGVTLAVAGGAG
jgi:1,4-dihydroxy-2-naphthoate octaprenyltransferase